MPADSQFWSVFSGVLAEMPFRDHHPYSTADLSRLADRMQAAGAARVVTTEKDYVRLLPFRPFPVAIDAVPLILDIDNRAALVDWLLSVVRQARA